MLFKMAFSNGKLAMVSMLHQGKKHDLLLPLTVPGEDALHGLANDATPPRHCYRNSL